jgi:hypothetical protein
MDIRYFAQESYSFSYLIREALEDRDKIAHVRLRKNRIQDLPLKSEIVSSITSINFSFGVIPVFGFAPQVSLEAPRPV